MKFNLEFIKLLFRKYIMKKSNGEITKLFCEKMGVAYIKLAQILSTQTLGETFTEKDRLLMQDICNDINPIKFKKIKQQLEQNYNTPLNNIFSYIESESSKSASISQVHYALLLDGTKVAIKVKRKDVIKNIEKDIEKLKKLMKKYSKHLGINNINGGNKILDMYIEWIKEETDFNNEIKNFELMSQFAETSNKNVKNIIPLKIPKIYKEHSNDEIIVMEYIEEPTLNTMVLTEQNKNAIKGAINSYLKVSFNALLNGKELIFHGDLHGGNIFINNSKNSYGLLDMGLMFKLSEKETTFIRDFFIAAFTKNDKKITEFLIPFGDFDNQTKIKFTEDVKNFTYKVKDKEITSYFTEMISICNKYNIIPPDFIFSLSKSFILLNGINGFSKNEIDAYELLKDELSKYYINKTIKKSKKIIDLSKIAIPTILKSIIKKDNIATKEEIDSVTELSKALHTTKENIKEITSVAKTGIKKARTRRK